MRVEDLFVKYVFLTAIQKLEGFAASLADGDNVACSAMASWTRMLQSKPIIAVRTFPESNLLEKTQCNYYERPFRQCSEGDKE
jgi:hypothetical protein